MPYKREGAMKVSNHPVRSPLLKINRACQTYHKWPEAELKGRGETIQYRTFELRNRARGAIVALIRDLAAARKSRRGIDTLAPAQGLQRRAQFMVDFVEAENSMGVHAPREAARIPGEAIDCARQGQLTLRPVSNPKP